MAAELFPEAPCGVKAGLKHVGCRFSISQELLSGFCQSGASRSP